MKKGYMYRDYFIQTLIVPVFVDGKHWKYVVQEPYGNTDVWFCNTAQHAKDKIDELHKNKEENKCPT